MAELSNYNYFINEKERIIYFNGLSKIIFSLSIEEHNTIFPLLKDLNKFQHTHPKEFMNFSQWGFIVDDKKDEINQIYTRNRLEVFNNDKYKIILNPTLNCNFNCWYCFESHEDKGYMSPVTLERLKKHLDYMVVQKKIKELEICYFGGEPLLYYKKVIEPLDQFVNILCKKYSIRLFCSFITNGSLINMQLIEQLQSSSYTYSFQITIDGGKEKHDQVRNMNGKPTLERIIENINLLCNELDNVFIILRVNYDNSTLDDNSLKDVFMMIKQENRAKVTIDLQRVFQTKQINSSGIENKKLFEYYDYCKEIGFKSDLGHSLVLDRFHKCYADLLSTTILNYDGKVYTCTARDYTEKNCIGELNEDGHLIYNKKYIYNKYAKPTFENNKCLNCKHLPICLGPCSQANQDCKDSNIEFICDNYLQEISFDSKIISYYHRIHG